MTQENTALETVSVQTQFIPEQSSSSDSQFVFSYTITITNNTDKAFQVMSRYWLITDADGETTIVEGSGIVGEQPHIIPGTSYTYTSGCLLKTPLGTMQGYYQVIDDNQETSIIDIPVFQLALPNIIH
ncbi:Co2+/Mg2+ efflux protein ApaG [Pseudocolwellia sp. AS88]|jgi:ApaG protein|uniref:Co2+/Mg2+ efflux protein ApaG n=1 Tax=Pseudocolwellia TaxID=2848177 RepID=UPI0026EA1CD2|nr:Co2+/Mg2+ efflux protein ApaG [Pseudocolwellia sp. AS88]MDO7084354.1 Co2+/Mg2+ efflux protein ApaG [Pseudocolwellia sp. AS88]